MIRERGIAYCGLACCICEKNDICEGCQKGACESHMWCKNYRCCVEKGIDGCYSCDEFPCENSMLDKVKIKAFSVFVRDYGKEKLMDCLEKNENDGVVYHQKSSVSGDYDLFKTHEEVIDFILDPKKCMKG